MDVELVLGFADELGGKVLVVRAGPSGVRIGRAYGYWVFVEEDHGCGFRVRFEVVRVCITIACRVIGRRSVLGCNNRNLLCRLVIERRESSQRECLIAKVNRLPDLAVSSWPPRLSEVSEA